MFIAEDGGLDIRTRTEAWRSRWRWDGFYWERYDFDDHMTASVRLYPRDMDWPIGVEISGSNFMTFGCRMVA